MKKAPQNEVSFRGQGETITATLPRIQVNCNGYSEYIPAECFRALHNEAAGLIHGTVTLTLHIRDRKLARFATSRERSYLPDEG